MGCVDVAVLGGCNKCHNNIPAVTDTFNESTLLLRGFSSVLSSLDRSDSSVFVIVVVFVENAGGIRTYSVQDLATSARRP